MVRTRNILGYNTCKRTDEEISEENKYKILMSIYWVLINHDSASFNYFPPHILNYCRDYGLIVFHEKPSAKRKKIDSTDEESMKVLMQQWAQSSGRS